ncbi:hypothetical protein SDC9_201017 [bioreactor metagenome]|uniref:Uncharacterized protein n=1 Tax=bioreactor metagenome TaxID=1076179 RepID=A0A645J1M5_9ZZZZ
MTDGKAALCPTTTSVMKNAEWIKGKVTSGDFGASTFGLFPWGVMANNKNPAITDLDSRFYAGVQSGPDLAGRSSFANYGNARLSPSERFIIGDSVYDGNPRSEAACILKNQNIGIIYMCHADRANIGFLDGHAAGVGRGELKAGGVPKVILGDISNEAITF